MLWVKEIDDDLALCPWDSLTTYCWTTVGGVKAVISGTSPS